VKERVVDQVSYRLLKAQRVEFGGEPRFCFNDQPSTQLVCPGGEALPAPLQEPDHLDALRVDWQPSLTGAGDDQKILGQAGQAIGLLNR